MSLATEEQAPHSPAGHPALSLRGISKRFGAVSALSLHSVSVAVTVMTALAGAAESPPWSAQPARPSARSA